MNGSASKARFWWAIIAQVAGAQVFFWDALPDYRQLTAGEVVVGTPQDFAFAVFGLVVMQSAYWYARRLQPRIRFRHRVVWGHFLLCVSEVSFFFVSALATVAMFDLQSAGWIGASPWNLMNEIFGIVISILVLAFAAFAGLNKSHENRGDQ